MIVPLILGGAALFYFATRGKKAAPSTLTGLYAQYAGKTFTTPQPAVTLSGASGSLWGVSASRGGGGTVVYALYLMPNGTPVLEFSQMNADPSTNAFLSSPMAGTDPILSKAMSDFGIRSQGGAVNQPAVSGYRLF